jgi:hypothetical protein
MLCVIILSVAFFIVILNVIMLSVIMLSVIMLNVANNPFKLSVFTLSVVMLNVIMMSVEAPISKLFYVRGLCYKVFKITILRRKLVRFLLLPKYNIFVSKTRA